MMIDNLVKNLREEEIEEPAGDDLDSDSDIKTEPVSFQV